MEDIKKIQEFFSKPLEENVDKKYSDFLVALRDSGVTNMFGAGPYLQAEFGLDKREAREILANWMRSFGESLSEGKQLDQVDFAKVVQAVTKTGHPVTVLLVPKFNEIEVITGMNTPDDMLFDLSNAVDALGYGRNDIIIAGDSSNLSRREYSDIFRVNGGHKDYYEESVNEMDMNDPILMKMRAAKDKLAKMRAANAGDDGNDKFFDNAKKIAFLKKEREQLMRDMEQEAEPEGGPIADEYGAKLNRIDAAIAKLSDRKEMTYDQAIAENDSYARVSKPRFKKDKNSPNFLNVYLDYDIGPGGATVAFGKETMSGQIRRLSSEKARKIAHDIALDLEANFNLEDIEVTDLENGKVRIFAVSDDFIDMDPNMLSEIKESLNPEVSNALNRFIKAMAKRYDYSEQDAVYAIMAALKQRDFDGVNEATEDEENEFHKDLDKLVHKTFGHSSDEKKKSMAQELAETIKLGEGVIEEELCPKGKAYIKRRKAAGEKSSAYLSGRAVKVCKGQMSGRKKTNENIITENIEDEMFAAMKNVATALEKANDNVKPSPKDKKVEEGVITLAATIVGAPGLMTALGKGANYLGKAFGKDKNAIGEFLKKKGHQLEEFYIESLGGWIKAAFPNKYEGQEITDESSDLYKAAQKAYAAMLTVAAVGAGYEAGAAANVVKAGVEGGMAVLKSSEVIDIIRKLT